jgi:hypothetical protein
MSHESRPFWQRGFYAQMDLIDAANHALARNDLDAIEHFARLFLPPGIAKLLAEDPLAVRDELKRFVAGRQPPTAAKLATYMPDGTRVEHAPRPEPRKSRSAFWSDPPADPGAYVAVVLRREAHARAEREDQFMGNSRHDELDEEQLSVDPDPSPRTTEEIERLLGEILSPEPDRRSREVTYLRLLADGLPKVEAQAATGLNRSDDRRLDRRWKAARTRLEALLDQEL